MRISLKVSVFFFFFFVHVVTQKDREEIEGKNEIPFSNVCRQSHYFVTSLRA